MWSLLGKDIKLPVTIGKIDLPFDVPLGVFTDLMMLSSDAEFDVIRLQNTKSAEPPIEAGSALPPAAQAAVRVRMRDIPNYYYGNFLLLHSAPQTQDIPHWIRTFDAAFADVQGVAHRTFVWSEDAAPSEDCRKELEALNFEVAWDAVLTCVMPSAPRSRPKELDVRRIESDADWEAVIASQIEIGQEDWDSPDYAEFKRRNLLQLRDMCQNGLGHWVGGFVQDALVSNMGIFAQNGVARYQSVGTHRAHRGRGYASSVLEFAAQYIRSTHSVDQFVIIAEAESNAQKLYQNCGFQFLENSYSILQRPPT